MNEQGKPVLNEIRPRGPEATPSGSLQNDIEPGARERVAASKLDARLRKGDNPDKILSGFVAEQNEIGRAGAHLPTGIESFRNAIDALVDPLEGNATGQTNTPPAEGGEPAAAITQPGVEDFRHAIDDLAGPIHQDADELQKKDEKQPTHVRVAPAISLDTLNAARDRWIEEGKKASAPPDKETDMPQSYTPKAAEIHPTSTIGPAQSETQATPGSPVIPKEPEAIAAALADDRGVKQPPNLEAQTRAGTKFFEAREDADTPEKADAILRKYRSELVKAGGNPVALGIPDGLFINYDGRRIVNPEIRNEKLPLDIKELADKFKLRGV